MPSLTLTKSHKQPTLPCMPNASSKCASLWTVTIFPHVLQCPPPPCRVSQGFALLHVEHTDIQSELQTWTYQWLLNSDSVTLSQVGAQGTDSCGNTHTHTLILHSSICVPHEQPSSFCTCLQVHYMLRHTVRAARTQRVFWNAGSHRPQSLSSHRQCNETDLQLGTFQTALTCVCAFISLCMYICVHTYATPSLISHLTHMPHTVKYNHTAILTITTSIHARLQMYTTSQSQTSELNAPDTALPTHTIHGQTDDHS